LYAAQFEGFPPIWIVLDPVLSLGRIAHAAKFARKIHDFCESHSARRDAFLFNNAGGKELHAIDAV